MPIRHLVVHWRWRSVEATQECRSLYAPGEFKHFIALLIRFTQHYPYPQCVCFSLNIITLQQHFFIAPSSLIIAHPLHLYVHVYRDPDRLPYLPWRGICSGLLACTYFITRHFSLSSSTIFITCITKTLHYIINSSPCIIFMFTISCHSF